MKSLLNRSTAALLAFAGASSAMNAVADGPRNSPRTVVKRLTDRQKAGTDGKRATKAQKKAAKKARQKERITP